MKLAMPGSGFKNISLPYHWQQPLIALGIVLAALLLIYSDTVRETAAIWWRSDTYAHGMVIIPFSLYMLWTQRRMLARLTPQMSWWGIAAMAPGIIGWQVGSIVNALVIEQLSLLWLVWSIILAVLGTQVVRSILFPLAFLFFAVPLGEGLIPLLMDFTAVFTVRAVELTGIPVYWEGLYFTIPSGSFEVAKACSGIRYLFASVALGSLFAYINYHSYWRRAIFIGIATVLPIIANGLRAYGIVMIAHLSDMELAVGVDHIIYGWIFFGIVMFILFLIGAKWREERNEDVSISAPPSQNRDRAKYWQPAAAVLLVVMLAAGPTVTLLEQRSYADSVPTISLNAPQGHQGWRTTADALDNWRVSFDGAADQIKRAYVQDDRQVNLFVAYYARETQGAELINAVNSFYRIKTWTQIASAEREIGINRKEKVYITELVLRTGPRKRLIWYWYDIGGVTVSDIYRGKLLQAWHRLSGQARGDAAVALMVEIHDEQRAQAVATLQSFIQSMYPGIEAEISRFRGDGK